MIIIFIDNSINILKFIMIKVKLDEAIRLVLQ